MADYATEQNLQLAQQLLKRQGEINALRNELTEARRARAAVEAERDALKAELATAVLILRRFTEFGPCDAYVELPQCTAHGWQDDDTCPFTRAELFLAALDAARAQEGKGG